MKAFLVQEQQSYLPTHKLKELSAECAEHSEIFSQLEIATALELFDAYDQVGRYGAEAKHDPNSVKKSQFETAGTWYWDDERLQKLDMVVYNIRALLNFSAVNKKDALLSILNKDRSHHLVALWRGRPALRVVLVKKNKYFS